MDNIFSGTNVAELDLIEKSINYKLYPVVNGEIGGLTNTSLTGDVITRITLGENDISRVSLNLNTGRASEVELLNFENAGGVSIYKVKSDGSIDVGNRKKRKFQMNRQIQSLSMVAYQTGGVTDIQLGLYDKEQSGDLTILPVVFGLTGAVVGGLISYALQEQGVMDYFYVVSENGQLKIPVKTPFQKIDDYEVWVRNLGIKPRNKARVMIDDKMFLAYWDKRNSKIRILKFYLR